MIIKDIYKGNTTIIRDTFGEIEIVKDSDVKEPINDLNYMLYKLKNSLIQLTIIHNNEHSITLPFFYNYKIIIKLNPTSSTMILHLNFNYIYAEYFKIGRDLKKLNIKYIDSIIKFYNENLI